MKKPLTERFQQLAGIKPLYTEQLGPRMSNPRPTGPSDDGEKIEKKQYEKVAFVYTEQGGRFYGLDVYESKDQDQRSDKLKYDDANEWLKETLEYIHEGDLIPRKYNSGIEDLDLIVERLEELDIEASYGDYMDVS